MYFLSKDFFKKGSSLSDREHDYEICWNCQFVQVMHVFYYMYLNTRTPEFVYTHKQSCRPSCAFKQSDQQMCYQAW